MLFSLFKASGHSMEPKIKNGSFFIATIIPYLLSKPKIGDAVVFENDGKMIVKKLVKIEKGKYFIEGENRLDSKKFGPIEKKQIKGKVIIKIPNYLNYSNF